MESIIDNLVDDIAAELLKSEPDREKILKLADALDAQSKEERKARHDAALQIVKKAYGLDISLILKVGPTAKTLASSLLALRGLGLSNEDIKDIVVNFPGIVGLSEEHIEARRKYFGFTKEEFAKVVKKFPQIVSYGEENIARRREYFGFTKEEFAKVVKTSPSIVGLSEEYIEARRKYFGFTKEEFAKVVKTSSNILSHSEEHIEARREYFGYSKEEFAKIISKFPSIFSNSEEHIEARKKYLGLDMKTFSEFVYTKPSILGRSEDNLERRFDWYKRHFGIKKEELVARLVEKPALYFSLFDASFYARMLLRTKAMTANGKTLNDVRDLASVLKFSEKEFVEKHGNGISLDDYNRLKEFARVTDEANPRKSRSKA
jgi:DNA-binding XRE family transcriptional regulator